MYCWGSFHVHQGSEMPHSSISTLAVPWQYWEAVEGWAALPLEPSCPCGSVGSSFSIVQKQPHLVPYLAQVHPLCFFKDFSKTLCSVGHYLRMTLSWNLLWVLLFFSQHGTVLTLHMGCVGSCSVPLCSCSSLHPPCKVTSLPAS